MELTGSVIIAESTDQLYDDLAAVLFRAAMRSIHNRGEFHLALSGGATPEPFYIRLMIDPRYRLFPWGKTHLWLVDERLVPPEDDRANIKLIRETIADHVSMPRRQIHPVPVDEVDPAGVYETSLRELVSAQTPLAGETSAPGHVSAASGDVPRLDFVLLGMGEDGHTASLFPQSPALKVTDRLVTANDGPTVTPPPRVTMTYPLLNAAREIAILVTGPKKTSMLQRVQQCLKHYGPDANSLPITGIAPHHPDAELSWFLDAPAAGQEAP
ncbi:MAG: 6-phosphogluconolactonase [Phycisphaeraceae bacterium]|nr:6-phosphogluconolactonase [Phycisphaeraceae bacterium]